MGPSHITSRKTLRHAAASEPEIKLAMSKLAADMKERLARSACKESSDFFLSTLRALTQIKGRANAEARMTCLFDCIRFFYTNNLHAAALSAVHSLDDLANRVQRKAWIRKAESAGAVIYADLGNIAEAVMRLSNALQISKNLGDVSSEISTLNNLSTALNYGGLYKEAMRCSQRAAQLANTSSDESLVLEWKMEATALTNLAQSYYYLSDFDAGYRTIKRALAISGQPTNAFAATSQCVREFTYILLALELEEGESAQSHAASCRRYANQAGLRAQALAEIGSGLCEVYRGNVDHGLCSLENSLRSSAHPGALRTDAVLALVKAFDAVGQPQRALLYVREILRQIQENRHEAALVLLSSGEGLNMFAGALRPNSTTWPRSDLLKQTCALESPKMTRFPREWICWNGSR